MQAARAPFRAQAPTLNLFDVPELLPGAQPRANPAAREDFEQRCRALHHEEDSEAERWELRWPGPPATEEPRALAGGALASELRAMFPGLDSQLVQSLAAEARSPQAAVDVLLALAAAAERAVGEPPAAARPRPPSVGVEDHDKFPLLTDGRGWQVCGGQQLQHEGELGSRWRDRAQAAAELPAPVPRPQLPGAVQAVRRARQGRAGEADGGEGPRAPDGPWGAEAEAEYEFRHRAGQRRAERRARRSRGGAGGACQLPAGAEISGEGWG